MPCREEALAVTPLGLGFVLTVAMKACTFSCGCFGCVSSCILPGEESCLSVKIVQPQEHLEKQLFELLLVGHCFPSLGAWKGATFVLGSEGISVLTVEILSHATCAWQLDRPPAAESVVHKPVQLNGLLRLTLHAT